MSTRKVNQFIREQCYFAQGSMIPFAEFYERFRASLSPAARLEWTRIKVSRCLPSNHSTGSFTGNKKFLPNLSWHPAEHKNPIVIRPGNKAHRRARILVKT